MTTAPTPWASFGDLVAGIGEVDKAAVLAAGRQARQLLTLRNWLVGTWLVHYEQQGQDRAAYGARLLDRLADALNQAGAKGLSARSLRNCRQVALAYPGLDPAPVAKQALGLGTPERIWQAPAKSSAPGPLPWRDADWLQRLFAALSFTHLLELARIDDEVERGFYELHSLKEGWSTRELIRQRATMLYQRVGLSTDRETVLALARQGQVDERPRALVRDPYVLEFLGLPEPTVSESTLEDALVAHLQAFLLELGTDFCFVARQYRITLGNRHHHLDLLFFHRGLRCLVAVDLKTTEFAPEHAGQMRFYLNFLGAEVARPDENPPIGILLCAGKDEEVVQYATATDDDVLVSRYLLQLPETARLEQWLHEARAATEDRLRDGALAGGDDGQ